MIRIFSKRILENDEPLEAVVQNCISLVTAEDSARLLDTLSFPAVSPEDVKSSARMHFSLSFVF